MADYQVFHDEATGQNYFRTGYDTKFVPISEQDLDVLEEGGLEAFMKSAVNSAGQLITGAGALVDQAITGGTEARERYDALRETQALRSEGSPIASFAGSIAPDVAAGIATGGAGSLLARIGGTAAVEGALGAVRNPDDPLEGAAIQGSIGAAVPLGGAAARAGGRALGGAAQRVGGAVRGNIYADRALERIGRSRRGMRADELEGRAAAVSDGTEPLGGAAARERQSLSAADNPDAPQVPRERALAGLLTPEEVDDLALELDAGPLLGQGNRRALAARVDSGEMERADQLRASEELASTSVLTDWAAGGPAAIKDNVKNAGTRLIMQELGTGEGARLTAENFRRLMGQSQEVFERAAAEAGDVPVAGRKLGQLQDIADEIGADDAGPIQRLIDNIHKDVTDRGGILRNRTLRDYRTKTGRQAMSAASGDKLERANAYREVQAWLDDLVEERVSPATQEALEDARYKWRILRALEGSNATTDAGGNVNLRSFINQYQRAGNRFFKSTSRTEGASDLFSRRLETLAYLGQQVVPSSGTAERLIHAGGSILGRGGR